MRTSAYRHTHSTGCEAERSRAVCQYTNTAGPTDSSSHSTVVCLCVNRTGRAPVAMAAETNIGFLRAFSSSSVFQYLSHRYLGLELPISLILRICGVSRMV